MNFSFILGSVAEVERLWSIAGNILSNNRKKMSPLFFESLLFLKVNRNYWDLALVLEAKCLGRKSYGLAWNKVGSKRLIVRFIDVLICVGS